MCSYWLEPVSPGSMTWRGSPPPPRIAHTSYQPSPRARTVQPLLDLFFSSQKRSSSARTAPSTDYPAAAPRRTPSSLPRRTLAPPPLARSSSDAPRWTLPCISPPPSLSAIFLYLPLSVQHRRSSSGTAGEAAALELPRPTVSSRSHLLVGGSSQGPPHHQLRHRARAGRLPLSPKISTTTVATSTTTPRGRPPR